MIKKKNQTTKGHRQYWEHGSLFHSFSKFKLQLCYTILLSQTITNKNPNYEKSNYQIVKTNKCLIREARTGELFISKLLEIKLLAFQID